MQRADASLEISISFGARNSGRFRRRWSQDRHPAKSDWQIFHPCGSKSRTARDRKTRGEIFDREIRGKKQS